MDEVTDLLEALQRYETRRLPNLDFETVKYARLDKLLADLQNPDYRPAPVPLRYRTDMTVARALERLWRVKFLESYFVIDQTRFEELPRTGLLKDVSFIFGPTKPGHELWQAQTNENLSEPERDAQFVAGQ
jgi:hypothetical protein